MKAVISVIGKDMVGILAGVSGICLKCNANIIDVTQTVMQDLFAMTMLVDISKCNVSFSEFSDEMNKLSHETGLAIHTMHEDIFNAMHRI